MRVQLSLETRPVCSRAPEFRRAYSVCTRPAGEERRSLCTGRNYFWNNFKRIFCFLNTVEHHFLGSNTRIRSNIPMVCQRAGRAFRSLREIRLRNPLQSRSGAVSPRSCSVFQLCNTLSLSNHNVPPGPYPQRSLLIQSPAS